MKRFNNGSSFAVKVNGSLSPLQTFRACTLQADAFHTDMIRSLTV